MSRYYRLLLDDYSAASFTSFDKDYFGTLKQIDGFFQAIKADEDMAKRQEYILSIYEQFLAGKKTISHNVAYREVPFLVPAKILGEHNSVLIDYSWEHLNTWRWPYMMKCDKAESTHLWISCYGKYSRCIQTRFTNLYYDGLGSGFRKHTGSAWGFPHQIECEGVNTFCRLFVEEKVFKNKAEAINDRINFMHNPAPIFDRVLDDIFADG